LLVHPVHNLKDFNCHSPRYFRPKFSCTKPCLTNPSFRCATRDAHSLYEWLMYHLQKMYILPALMTRLIILPDFFQRYKAARLPPQLIPQWHHDDVLHASSLALTAVQPSIPAGHWYFASFPEWRKIEICVSRILLGP